MKVHFRQEGLEILNGVNITLQPSLGRLHIQYQYQCNGITKRLRMAIPRAWEQMSMEDFQVESNFEIEFIEEEN